MAYTTTQDLENAAGGVARYVQIFDADGDGVADAAIVAAAQAEADGVIDGHAAVKYAVPIAAPTATIKALAARLTIFARLTNSRMLTNRDLELHELDLKKLEAISKGQIRVSDPAPAKSSAVRAKLIAPEVSVSRDSLKGFI